MSGEKSALRLVPYANGVCTRDDDVAEPCGAISEPPRPADHGEPKSADATDDDGAPVGAFSKLPGERGEQTIVEAIEDGECVRERSDLGLSFAIPVPDVKVAGTRLGLPAGAAAGITPAGPAAASAGPVGKSGSPPPAPPVPVMGCSLASSAELR